MPGAYRLCVGILLKLEDLIDRCALQNLALLMEAPLLLDDVLRHLDGFTNSHH